MEHDEIRSAYEPPGSRRFRARDAVVVVLVAVLVLLVFEGDAIRQSGEEMTPGWERTLVLAAGEPAGWVADRLGVSDVDDELTASLNPDEDLGSAGGGFGDERTVPAPGAGGVPPVTPESFDPAELGARPPPKRPLKKVLVTGDSMAMPLDTELARRLTGVEVLRDPHVGTGISKDVLVDWSKLATQQAAKDEPDAVVVFIGANEGFPIGDSECCGPRWAAAYGSRVRTMMNTYRRGGKARVYWVTLPLPRDGERQRIARAVNAAIEVAATPYRSQVRVFDTVPIFTPKGYRDSMPVDGDDAIVRESDGIHLNARGAELAAERVLELIERDFTH